MLRSLSFLGIAGLGAMLVLSLGQLDLSVGSGMGLAGAYPAHCGGELLAGHAQARVSGEERKPEGVGDFLHGNLVELEEDEDGAALDVDVLPPKVQNLAKASAGKDQKSQGRGSISRQQRPSIFFFWQMLRQGFCRIRRPRDPYRFPKTNGGANSVKITITRNGRWPVP